jgi:chromosome segregation ATPase
MSEDLTKKLPSSDSEKIALILTTVQNLETRVDRLEGRFDALENRVDERLRETRPIWEKVVADIAQLQEGQTRLEADVHEIKVSIRDIYYKMDVLNETMVSVQAKHREVDRRVRELEAHQNKPSNSQT